MRMVLLVLGVVGLVIVAGWLGFQIKPRAFPSFEGAVGPIEIMAIPTGLPLPVERFYREVYGDNLPVVESVVISGRARLRVGFLRFSARFRFIHRAGSDYRHYIEGTCFGIPLLKVNEHFLDGQARMEMLFGVIENQPTVDRAANIALWAEAIWFPTFFLTDPRVKWEPVDDETAILAVPYGETTERFVVRFDPATGLVRLMEVMRHKGPTDAERVLWLNEAREWRVVDGYLVPALAAVIWLDEGTPWAVFAVEEVVLNADVGEAVRSRGR